MATFPNEKAAVLQSAGREPERADGPHGFGAGVTNSSFRPGRSYTLELPGLLGIAGGFDGNRAFLGGFVVSAGLAEDTSLFGTGLGAIWLTAGLVCEAVCGLCVLSTAA
jgi:hypothetical protein